MTNFVQRYFIERDREWSRYIKRFELFLERVSRDLRLFLERVSKDLRLLLERVSKDLRLLLERLSKDLRFLEKLVIFGILSNSKAAACACSCHKTRVQQQDSCQTGLPFCSADKCNHCGQIANLWVGIAMQAIA